MAVTRNLYGSVKYFKDSPDLKMEIITFVNFFFSFWLDFSSFIERAQISIYLKYLAF